MSVQGSHDGRGERESLPRSVEQLPTQTIKGIHYSKVIIRERQPFGLVVELYISDQVF